MLKFVPLTKEKMNLLPKVSSPVNNVRGASLEANNQSVLSEKLFAPKFENTEGIVTDVTYTRMAAIKLPIPIPNPFLLTKANVWAVTLDMKGNTIKDIAEGNIVMSKETGELVRTETCNATYGSKGEAYFYIGGEVLIKLLENAVDSANPNNIEVRLRRSIAKRYINKEYFQSGVDPATYVTKENTEVHLFGDYFLDTLKIPQYKGMPEFTRRGLSILDRKGPGLHSTDVINYSDYEDEDAEYSIDEDEQEDDYDADLVGFDDIESAEASLIDIADRIDDIDYSSEYSEEDDDYEDGEDFAWSDYGASEYDDWDVINSDKDSVKQAQYNPLSILQVMNTKEGLTRLKDSIMHFLPVLPYGYRRSFSNATNYKSFIYDVIFNKAQELNPEVTSYNDTVDTFAAKYNILYKLIKLLFIGDDATMRRFGIQADKFKSINDELKSKHGLIRSTLEGARFDYTARSVIISSPNMKVDSCGLPIEIVANIFMPILGPRFVRDDLASTGQSELNIDIPEHIKHRYTFYINWIRKNGYKQNLYCFLGRQPTLHYLGTQPNKVIPVEGEAIIVSPMVVEPFNADFDGDQMHVEAVLSSAAHREVRTNKLLNQIPRITPNGEIAIAPRLEMVYGLYLCLMGTTAYDYEPQTYTSANLKASMSDVGINTTTATDKKSIVLLALQKSFIAPSDIVDGEVAGHIALSYVLFNMDMVPVDKLMSSLTTKKKNEVKLNAKNVTKLVCATYNNNPDAIATKLKEVVLLGNGVANRFPPRLTLDVPEKLRTLVQTKVKAFNDKMYEEKDLVNLGLQNLSTYDSLFTSEWNKLASEIDKAVAEYMPIDNGFVLMASTGAKGNSGVLRQLFGVKGRIKQVLDRPFNCIIQDGYSGTMSGLDHYCSAYGSRDDLKDKVLSTSKPGYLSRKLEHAGATQSIVHTDCNTTEGIELDITDIVDFLADNDPTVDWYFWSEEQYERAKTNPRYQNIYQKAKEYVVPIIMHRYVVVNKESVYVTDEKKAIEVINDSWGEDFPAFRQRSEMGAVAYKPVVLRSPITCKCPICQKCYGYDPTTLEDAPDVGKQVGFIAAQAISEPGTQMSMKNFQKGGVAGNDSITSSLGIVCSYFDVQGRSKTNKIPYDFVSPVPAVVKIAYNMDGTQRLQLYEIADIQQAASCIERGVYNEIETRGGNIVKKNILFPENVTFKPVVQAGETVVRGPRYLDPKQVNEAKGCASTVKYMMLQLCDIYRESNVKGIHIETILSGMILGYLYEDIHLNIDGKEVVYPAGTMISRSLLSMHEDATADNLRVSWMPIGIKQLPKYKPDSSEAMIMEAMSTYLPRSVLLQPYDSFVNPIIRVALNKGIYKY